MIYSKSKKTDEIAIQAYLIGMILFAFCDI